MVVFTSCSFLNRSSPFILSHEESRSYHAETLLPVNLENMPTGFFFAYITVIMVLSNRSFMLYDSR